MEEGDVLFYIITDIEHRATLSLNHDHCIGYVSPKTRHAICLTLVVDF